MHNTIHQVLRFLFAEVAEAQRIQRRYRACAHRKNIAVNTPHAGCRTLERLNGRWVVMAFNFKHHAPAVADIGKPRVFLAGFHQQLRALAGQRFQPLNRIFIAAMLAPHYGISAQLRKIRCAAQYLFYHPELIRTKSQLFGGFNCCFHVSLYKYRKAQNYETGVRY